MKIEILGAATTKFGELWQVSPRALVKEAVTQALSMAHLSIADIEAIFVGNMLSGILGGQEHLGAFYAEELGVSLPAMKIEGACSSGGLAIHAACQAINSGMYQTVLVVGVEKMTDHKPEEVAKALMGAGSEIEREAGATFPALYALMARVHMEKYGTAEEELAHVAVKNHFHACLNSHAQFPFPVSVEKVLNSPVIASPLKLLDCSPISDGAAAIVFSKKPQASSLKRQVYLVASAVATDSLGLAQRDDLTTLAATRRAVQKAYQQAGIGPSDIDVAEVHDCFTIAEIIAMEDLGFYKKGEAARAIAKGETRLDRKKGDLVVPIVNTSGGLKAAGHPVGATGVKQLVEIYHQLNGTAGKKQIEGARIGLTHNVGGSGGTAVVHIVKSLK